MARRTVIVTQTVPRHASHPPLLFRLIWLVVIGWWLAPLWFVCTLVLTPLVGLIAAPELARMYRFTSRLFWL